MWGHHNSPPITQAGPSTILFHDYPYLWDLEIGDRIETYALGAERITLKVTDIRPADLPDFPPELRLVTAEVQR